MAFSISIPFYGIKMHLRSGETIISPVGEPQYLALNESLSTVSHRFSELFQEIVLDQGEYLKLLDHANDIAFIKDKINVWFDAAKDGFSYPEFGLEFEYFYKKTPAGYWCIVPSIGIETFTKSGESRELALQDAIEVDFLRKKRLASVQQIISTIWFEKVELLREEITLELPGLEEIEDPVINKKDLWLPKVAKLLDVDKKITFGRKAELAQLAKALNTKFSRNVILAGPSGVGKTALVWELARQQKKFRLKGRIWETTASTLIKELTADTGWEDNMARLCNELSGGEDILYVRNLLALFEVGKYVGNDVSMADFMRSYISRGEISLIAESTDEELSRIELKSPNFISFFQVIKMEEPKTDLEEIIVSKVKSLAGERRLVVEKEAIEEAIRLSRRFTPYAGFPGKPLRFLESLLINQESENLNINTSEVISGFCEETGMPQFLVDHNIPMDIEATHELFRSNVFGQEAAVEQILNLITSVKTALTRTGKPIASLLFVGPTGVGKTEMAKVLAEYMFGSREKMLRFDMSEFSDPWSVLRLTGESYFTNGLLTSAVRREPFSVLLFDEIEKAHPDFYDLLLQILGEGRLTDSEGRLVNFCSTIIIMTSNIGAAILQNKPIGWKDGDHTKNVGENFIEAARKYFRPELFNRIDQIIPFDPLSLETVRFIVEKEIRLLKKREGIAYRKVELILREGVLDYLAENGYSMINGARNLQRFIREKLVIPLAKNLNTNDFDDQLTVVVQLKNNQLEMIVEADPLGLELLFEELDKINFADHSGELRRQIFRLQEGHYFVRLLSEIDLLEREKLRLGESFWANREKTTRYAEKLQFIDRTQKLTREIETLEENLTLAVLDLNTYNTGLIPKLKDWEEKFFNLKVDLLALEKPTTNRCFFSIYGSGLQDFIDLYLNVFSAKNYEIDAKTIWVSEQPDKKGNQGSIIKKNWNPALFIGRDGTEGNSLYGVEMNLSGACVLEYLKDEIGIHHWKMSSSENHTFVVAVNESELTTPAKINRKEFYKGNPRRVFSPGHFKDNRMKIRREVARNQFSKLLLEILDNRFENFLDMELT